MSKPYVIHMVNNFGVSFVSGNPTEFLPFSEEVAKLPIPSCYHAQIVEIYSDYNHYLGLLVELLRPVAEKLELLLRPWVQLATPLLERWEAYFNTEESKNFVKARTYLHDVEYDVLHLSLRYFPASGGYLRVWGQNSIAGLMMGIGMEIGGTMEESELTLSDGEFSALRLLSNPDRMAMLQAMMKTPMSGQELVQELGLNSGTVFRDLNNMSRAMLINRVSHDGKNIYRTNFAMLRKLTQRILDVVNPEEA